MGKLEFDVKPSGMISGVAYEPFDHGLKMLKKNNLDLISLAQNANLRISQGEEADISQNGNWVKEGVIYVPYEKAKIVRNSPIIDSAVEATNAYRKGREFYPNKDAVESALSDSINFPRESIEIPTKRFGSETLTVYMFGGEEQAKAYGDFLGDAGINKMPVWAVDNRYVNDQSQPFARQVWFHGLGGDGSDVDGDWDLLGDGWVRGVSLVSSEAGAQKISNGNSELYSPKQIASALSGLKMSGLEAQLMSKLRNK